MIQNPIITGKKLPTLTSPGSASDLLAGKQLIDAEGNIVDGSIPSLEAQTLTPGAEDQTIEAGQYLKGAQTIQGDANLVAENIKSGVSIFGVSGALSDGIKLYEDDSLTATVLSEYSSILSSTFYSLKINLPITVSEIVGFIIYGQDSSGRNCVICGLIREDYSNKYWMGYGLQNSIVNGGSYSFESNSLTTGQIWNSPTTGDISSFSITHCTIFYR